MVLRTPSRQFPPLPVYDPSDLVSRNGHGIAATLTGSNFERLLIFADSSGVAETLRPADASRLTDALVSASGPLGPAIAGSAFVIASRCEKSSRLALTGAIADVMPLPYWFWGAAISAAIVVQLWWSFIVAFRR